MVAHGEGFFKTVYDGMDFAISYIAGFWFDE